MMRQQWLVQLTKKLKPLFEDAGHTLPVTILSTKDTKDIDGLPAAYLKEGTWFITLSNLISDKIEAAETLIHTLVFRVISCDVTSQRLIFATLIGYRGNRPDGDKLAFGLRRLVQAMSPYPPQMTRKSWLTRLVDELRPLFSDIGHPLPKITAAPGWAYPGYPRNGMVKFTTGECHIFIWPQFSESLNAALALVRELPRSALDGFTRQETIDELASRIGLDGDEPSPALKFLLNNIIADLGKYPEN